MLRVQCLKKFKMVWLRVILWGNYNAKVLYIGNKKLSKNFKGKNSHKICLGFVIIVVFPKIPIEKSIKASLQSLEIGTLA